MIPLGWKDNRRSDVTQAMRQRLQWFIHPWAYCLRNGDDHPAYTSHWVSHTLPLH